MNCTTCMIDDFKHDLCSEEFCKKCGAEGTSEDVEQMLMQSKLVRCKDCRHRIVNEHYGEKGYMKLKAMCELDTGDIFQLGRHAEDDDWFCADAEERKI